MGLKRISAVKSSAGLPKTSEQDLAPVIPSTSLLADGSGVPSLRSAAKVLPQNWEGYWLPGPVSFGITLSDKDHASLRAFIKKHGEATFCLPGERNSEVVGNVSDISWQLDDGDTGVMSVGNVRVRIPGEVNAKTDAEIRPLAQAAFLAAVDSRSGAAIFPLATQKAKAFGSNLQGMVESLVANEPTARGKFQALGVLHNSASRAFYDAQAPLVNQAICEMMLEFQPDAEAREGAELVGIELERCLWTNDDDSTSEFPKGLLMFKDADGEVYTSGLDAIRMDGSWSLDRPKLQLADELEEYAVCLTGNLLVGDKVQLLLADPNTIIPVEEEA